MEIYRVLKYSVLQERKLMLAIIYMESMTSAVQEEKYSDYFLVTKTK